MAFSVIPVCRGNTADVPQQQGNSDGLSEVLHPSTSTLATKIFYAIISFYFEDEPSIHSQVGQKQKDKKIIFKHRSQLPHELALLTRKIKNMARSLPFVGACVSATITQYNKYTFFPSLLIPFVSFIPADKMTSPHLDTRMKYLSPETPPTHSSLVRIFTPERSVIDFDTDNVDPGLAHRVLCRIFAINQTLKIIKGQQVWRLKPLIPGYFCKSFVLEEDQPPFHPNVDNSAIIVKTLLYKRHHEMCNQSKEKLLLLLYHSHLTYETIRTFVTPSGKRIRVAEVFNLPHLDGYIACKKIPFPCQPVRWGFVEESDGSLRFSRVSQKRINQLCDFFEVAVLLALKHDVYLDLSPNNLHFDHKGNLHLIDTLGFHIDTSGWNFLFTRLRHWTKTKNGYDIRIFETLMKYFPHEIKELFLESFPDGEIIDPPSSSI